MKNKILMTTKLLTLTLCLPVIANAKPILSGKFFSTKSDESNTTQKEPLRYAKTRLVPILTSTVKQDDGTFVRKSTPICTITNHLAPVSDLFNTEGSKVKDYSFCDFIGTNGISLTSVSYPYVQVGRTSAGPDIKLFGAMVMALPRELAEKMKKFETTKEFEKALTPEEMEQINSAQNSVQFNYVSTTTLSLADLSFGVGAAFASAKDSTEDVLSLQVTIVDDQSK